MSERATGFRSRPTSSTRSGGASSNAAQLKVVRRSSKKLIKRERATRLAPLAILGGIVAVAVVFGVLLEQVVLAQSAFKLTRVRERLAAAEERHQELLLQAAKLESSDRIARFARDELGMVEPGPGEVQYLSADIYRSRKQTVANIAPAATDGRAGPPGRSVAAGGP
jgi:cell division protein FtsB